MLFSDGSVTDIHGSLSGDIGASIAWDVNDDGAVVVTTGDTTRSFLFKDGKATPLDGRGLAINDRGQIAGMGWIRDADGSLLKLQAFKDQYFEPSSLNNSGSVVGFADIDPGPLIGFSAFRTKPGEPLNMSRDLLKFAGTDTRATGVNDEGQVSGYGKDGGVDIPIIWDGGGRAVEQTTPFGGRVEAINNSGIGAGMMYASNGGPRAAIYVNGHGTDLTDPVRAAGWDVNLRYATGINDLGQVAVVGRYDSSLEDHAFLLDLGLTPPTIKSLKLETRLYPLKEWVPVPENGTVDGNEVRITVETVNRTDQPASAQLQLVEDVSAKTLPGGRIDLIFAPNETITRQVVWDTAGFAWHKGRARSERAMTAQLFTGGDRSVSRTEPIIVRPKPAVLVHGFKSDAEETWGDYASILASAHPGLKKYAVDTLETGNVWLPFKGTLNLLDNAKEVADYVEEVREKEGANHVDLIGHGMGGLIARGYIFTLMPKSWDGKPAVNRMLQMGTPNRGTPCADMIIAGLGKVNAPMSYWPALLETSEHYAKTVLNKYVTDLKGVTASNLVGVGNGVYCTGFDEDGDVTLPTEDGDSYVPESSAKFTYTDIPYTLTSHSKMPANSLSYIQTRLASVLASTSNPGGVEFGPNMRPDAKSAEDVAGERDEGTALATAAEGDGDAVVNAASTFATPTVTVAPGETVSVPLDVPSGTGFGVTGALPATVGMLLRDPSGKPAASYAGGGDAAKQPIQGLRVAKPQAGAWKLELTNTGTEPVTAGVVAWVAGNPVKVAVKVRQPSEDGRVKVSATVTDDGRPVTGAPVKAVLLAEDATRVELTLSDDGAGGDGSAGDGVYGGTSEPLADGVYAVTVKADTAKGVRDALDVIEVKQPDTREFALTLSAGPGGSVAASPAQEVYRPGTTVTVTATPEAGRVPIGWVVDGQERGAGALTLVMNEAHTVEARFGTYKVTEIGTLPGGDASRTYVETLNDRGQVAATVTKDGKAHAVRWQDGQVTELGGPACTDGSSSTDRCGAGALGINQAGDVSGWAVASVNGRNSRHAVIWRNDGSVTDLQPGNSATNTVSAAIAVNDNGQVFGDAGVRRYVIWDRGAAVALPSEYAEGLGYDDDPYSNHLPRINGRGAVTGGYAIGRDAAGLPRDSGPAVYTDGVLTKLAGTVKGCAATAGQTSDINNAGLVVGTLRCGRDEGKTIKRAHVWKDGKPTDLGVGEAAAVNDNGVIVGFEQEPYLGWHKQPMMWVDGTKYPLAGVLSRPLCPQDALKTIQPCMGVRKVQDINSSGQILVQGYVRDRSPDSEGFPERDRSFLLTPTTAQADLEVSAAVSATEPGPGAKVTWTATVTNTGEDTATDVRLDVFTPPGVTGAACDTWRGKCTPIKGGFRNTVKVLEKGWSATVEVSATIPAGTADGTEFKTHAMADSLAVSDPKITNNGVEVTSTVRPLLSTTGIVWPEPVQVGQVSYASTVTLTNRLNDPIPLRVIAAGGPFTQTNDCPVELAVGKACTVQVRFAPTVEGPAGGALTFTTAEGAEAAFTVSLTGQGAKAGGTPVLQVPAAPVR
ncbi:choice-of-anchor X domain-containing protein, partial [Streptosporangium sp. NPDC049248]|uniref:choice-of-anchor X domain-containing protein n=1 Tax=Streptosporangium sp. NPDC049248 TaxID=3155651 RepID=UPI0034461592